jgi:hypothetical protein
VLIAALLLAGCEARRDRPVVAESTPPPGFVPPADAAAFWKRLRALHPRLRPEWPEADRLAACHELGAMVAYAGDHREVGDRIENSDFDRLEMDGKACLRPDPGQQRLAYTDVGSVLHRDPFTTPTP